MSAAASFVAAAFVRSYDLGGIEQLVDVGGGHGMLMRAVLDAHPHLQGGDVRPAQRDQGHTRPLGGRGLDGPLPGDRRGSSTPCRPAAARMCSPGSSTTGTTNRRPASCPTAARMGDAGRLLAIELIVPSDDEQQPSPDIEWIVKTTDIEMLAADRIRADARSPPRAVRGERNRGLAGQRSRGRPLHRRRLRSAVDRDPTAGANEDGAHQHCPGPVIWDERVSFRRSSAGQAVRAGRTLGQVDPNPTFSALPAAAACMACGRAHLLVDMRPGRPRGR